MLPAPPRPTCTYDGRSGTGEVRWQADDMVCGIQERRALIRQSFRVASSLKSTELIWQAKHATYICFMISEWGNGNTQKRLTLTSKLICIGGQSFLVFEA